MGCICTGNRTDMRKSYDGLQARARHAMGHNPLDGVLSGVMKSLQIKHYRAITW